MRIVFRTEGNHAQGLGDVWGCLAIAAQCSPGVDDVRFMVAQAGEAEALIRSRGFAVQRLGSWEEEARWLRTVRPEVVVVNKLDNDPGYLRTLKTLVPFVVTIDDAGPAAHEADLRVNVLYHVAGAITDYRYVALRAEFQVAHATPRRIAQTVRRLLILQGGSDTRGMTPRILRALDGLTVPLECIVVLGAAFRHDVELTEVVRASSLRLTIRRDVREMAGLMQDADVAITAGGLSLFELCCVGTPSLVVCGERFEVETAQRMQEAGAVINLGFGGDAAPQALRAAVERFCADAALRARLSARGRELVDGQGAGRIICLIRDAMTHMVRCVS